MAPDGAMLVDLYAIPTRNQRGGGDPDVGSEVVTMIVLSNGVYPFRQSNGQMLHQLGDAWSRRMKNEAMMPR